MRLQPVIKWSGSKRSQAEEIIKNFPKSYNDYYEPFIGGGSILGTLQPQRSTAGDTCRPLIDVWKMIQKDPETLSEHYRENWDILQENRDHYYVVRDKFNEKNNPEDFLFLTRTAYNGLVRFNKSGNFNTSFHTNRPGIHPDKLHDIILDWSQRIKNTEFYCQDVKQTISGVSKGDLVYLDPPYANTKGMYQDVFTTEYLYEILEELNNRGSYWLLSFDGKTNYKDNTVAIPEELYENMIYTGEYNSSFSRLRGNKNTKVRETLYMNFL